MSARTDSEEFPVAPPGKAARVFLAMFTLVIPLMILAGMVAFPQHRPSLQVLVLSSAVVVLVAAVLLGASRRRSIRLVADRLEVKATFYSRSVALSSIEADAARIVDLREHTENKPRLKTNGYAVPGLVAGNFRDRNGHKLFCLVTAPRVLMLPLSDGSRMLLSPAQPNRLLERIRAVRSRVA